MKVFKIVFMVLFVMMIVAFVYIGIKGNYQGVSDPISWLAGVSSFLCASASVYLAYLLKLQADITMQMSLAPELNVREITLNEIEFYKGDALVLKDEEDAFSTVNYQLEIKCSGKNYLHVQTIKFKELNLFFDIDITIASENYENRFIFVNQSGNAFAKKNDDYFVQEDGFLVLKVPFEVNDCGSFKKSYDLYKKCRNDNGVQLFCDMKFNIKTGLKEISYRAKGKVARNASFKIYIESYNM